MNNNDKIYKIAKTQVDFVKSVLGKRFSVLDNAYLCGVKTYMTYLVNT